jgi:hypothetical protein
MQIDCLVPEQQLKAFYIKSKTLSTIYFIYLACANI